jgi:hypothetical protein
VEEQSDPPIIEYSSPPEKKRVVDLSLVIVWTVMGLLGTIVALAFLEHPHPDRSVYPQ